MSGSAIRRASLSPTSTAPWPETLDEKAPAPKVLQRAKAHAFSLSSRVGAAESFVNEAARAKRGQGEKVTAHLSQNKGSRAPSTDPAATKCGLRA